MGIYEQIINYAENQLKGNVLGWKKSLPETRWSGLTYMFTGVEKREEQTCFLFDIIDEGKNTDNEEIFSLDELSNLEIISSESKPNKSIKSPNFVSVNEGYSKKKPIKYPPRKERDDFAPK